jgi:hypothetical protein
MLHVTRSFYLRSRFCTDIVLVFTYIYGMFKDQTEDFGTINTKETLCKFLLHVSCHNCDAENTKTVYTVS